MLLQIALHEEIMSTGAKFTLTKDWLKVLSQIYSGINDNFLDFS